jgi:flagellar motor switch/type III secretory pathway protein FliN
MAEAALARPQLVPDLVSERWADAELLPCHFNVEIAVPQFTVRGLFRLEVGSLVETQWAQSADIPLQVNKQLIGWGEFEVSGDHLAVRLTELY